MRFIHAKPAAVRTIPAASMRNPCGDARSTRKGFAPIAYPRAIAKSGSAMSTRAVVFAPAKAAVRALVASEESRSPPESEVSRPESGAPVLSHMTWHKTTARTASRGALRTPFMRCTSAGGMRAIVSAKCFSRGVDVASATAAHACGAVTPAPRAIATWSRRPASASSDSRAWPFTSHPRARGVPRAHRRRESAAHGSQN